MRTLRRLAVVQPESRADLVRLARYLAEAGPRVGIEVRVCSGHEPWPFPAPDAALVLSPRMPKLTSTPTYGLLLSPWSDYQVPQLLRNVLGWDAYLTPSARVQQWVEDIAFGARKRAPIAFWVPSVPLTSAPQPGCVRTRAAIVPGSHGIDALERLVSPAACARLDGDANLIARLREMGIAVWLDTPGAVSDGQVALGLLEAIAAGAVAITSRHAFNEQRFGDALLYVDSDAPLEVQAWQIEQHVAWIRSHQAQADAMAARAHAIFAEHFALEVQFPALEAFHAGVLAEKLHVVGTEAADATWPSVTYVLRTDGSPQRALESLRGQQYPGLRVIVAPRFPGFDVGPIVSGFSDLSPTVLPPSTGGTSSALWQGLRAVRESGVELFGMLDDRDELFPNHVRTVVRSLENLEGRSWFGACGLAYSGAVEQARRAFVRDRLAAVDAPEEMMPRRIRHFRFYHPGYLDDGAHEVHPGAFLARTALLDDELLIDPEFETGSESYLQLLLAEKTLFGFTCEVTVATYDREDDAPRKDEVATLDEVRQRTFFRTYGRQFPAAAVYMHNVVFMTGFDKDLLAPLIQPPRPDDQVLEAILPGEPMGFSRRHGRVIRVSGRPASGVALTCDALLSGRYRIRCFFASGPAGSLQAPPFTVGILASPSRRRQAEAALVSLQPISGGWVAEHELDVRSEDMPTAKGLAVTARTGEGFDFIGARIDRLARILSRSVLELPVDRPLWLYGAGQGGRQAKRKLELAGLRVSGFIDKFKTGTLEGLPIVDLETARHELEIDTTLIIASMFWEEIRNDIEAAGVAARLYSLYPVAGDVVYALN